MNHHIRTEDTILKTKKTYRREGHFPAVEVDLEFKEYPNLKNLGYQILPGHKGSKNRPDFESLFKVGSPQALSNEVMDHYQTAIFAMRNHAEKLNLLLSDLTYPDVYTVALERSFDGGEHSPLEILCLFPDTRNVSLLNKVIALLFENTHWLKQAARHSVPDAGYGNRRQWQMRESSARELMRPLPDGLALVFNELVTHHPDFFEIADNSDSATFETYHGLKAKGVI